VSYNELMQIITKHCKCQTTTRNTLTCTFTLEFERDWGAIEILYVLLPEIVPIQNNINLPFFSICIKSCINYPFPAYFRLLVEQRDSPVPSR